jgi:DNA polymerase III epsilon subunit-like protein
MANSMVHWNGCHMVAIDTETTGLDPRYHEVVQVAMVALDSNFNPRQDVLPFYMLLQPEYPERMDPKAMSINKLTRDRLMTEGMNRIAAIDLLEHWVDSLGLPNNRSGYNRCKIIPLGQNYTFDKAFLQAWLGVEQYDEWFHYHYRDTMTTALFINDCHAMKAEPAPFPKVNLAYLCSQLQIPTPKAHDALGDCVAAAQVYKRMVNTKAIFL